MPKLFPAATVQKSADGRFELVYYARNRAIQHLIAKNKLSSYSVTEEAVLVTSKDESEAQELLQLLQKTDTLSGGAFVIRGKLRDASVKPVSGATVVRWNSTYFSLDPNNPEMHVDIQIP